MIAVSEFISLWKEFWPWIALAVILVFSLLGITWFIVRKMINQMEIRNEMFIRILTEKLDSLIKNSGKRYANKEESIYEFRLALRDHIWTKLEIIWDILERNSIKRRRKEIEQYIRTEFDRITRIWADHLSWINSPAGDMWQMLREIDFDKFYKQVFAIVFKDIDGTKDSIIREKIKDLKTLMNWCLNDLILEIQERCSR